MRKLALAVVLVCGAVASAQCPTGNCSNVRIGLTVQSYTPAARFAPAQVVYAAPVVTAPAVKEKHVYKQMPARRGVWYPGKRLLGFFGGCGG